MCSCQLTTLFSRKTLFTSFSQKPQIAMSSFRSRSQCIFSFIIIMLWIMIQAQDVYNTSNHINYFNDIIQCNNDTNCTIICNQSYGCRRSTVICPTNHQCDITCSADYACYDVCDIYILEIYLQLL